MRCVLHGIPALGLALLVCGAQGFFLPNVTHLEKLLSKYQQDRPHSRARRAIPRVDQEEILMLHNKLRGQVSPPASNMEHMVSGAPGSSPPPLALPPGPPGSEGSQPRTWRANPALPAPRCVTLALLSRSEPQRPRSHGARPPGQLDGVCRRPGTDAQPRGWRVGVILASPPPLGWWLSP